MEPLDLGNGLVADFKYGHIVISCHDVPLLILTPETLQLLFLFNRELQARHPGEFVIHPSIAT